MAKKKDAAFDEFLADVLATIPEGDARKQAEELLANEAVTSKLREGVLARAEFSRSMDALKTREQELARLQGEATTNAKAWSDWYAKASSEVATVNDRLKQYEQLYGELEPGVRREMRAGEKYMTEAEFQQKLAEAIGQRDSAAIAVADELTDLKIDHFNTFKEKLDTQSLIGLATKNGVRLKQAYDEMVSDRRREMADKAVEERVARERDEAVREYASKHQLPFTPGPAEPSGLDTLFNGAEKAPRDQRGRVTAALDEFSRIQSAG